MRESNVRQEVLKRIKVLDPQPVENPISPGCPDVEYVGGWIELKYLDKYPARMYISVIRVPHFTDIQRYWIKKRVRAGGTVFLMIRIVNDWFLLPGKKAAEHLGINWVRKDLIDNSVGHWLGQLPPSAELVTILAGKTLGNGCETGHATGDRVSPEMEAGRPVDSGSGGP